MTRQLVEAFDLHAMLGAPRLRLFDCGFSLADPHKGRADYDAGHIPGAFYAHLDDDLAGRPGGGRGRHPLPAVPAFIRTLGRFGVAAGDHVVVYDDSGGAIAARLWWMLRWVGLESVRLLNGGIQAWLRAGYALETDSRSPQPLPFVGDAADALTASTADVERRAQQNMVLVDARAAVRYRGEKEPIDPVAGHIPGALNLPFEENLDADGRFFAPQRLRRRFADIGIGAANAASVVHMCGSGVTACHNLLAMEQAGLPGSRLYPGSWSAWVGDGAREVARIAAAR